MLDILFNNLTANLLGLAVLATLWLASGAIGHALARRTCRAFIVFLGLPFLYLGHPLTLGSIWMFLLVVTVEGNYQGVLIFVLLGIVFIGSVEGFHRLSKALKRQADKYASNQR